MLAVASDPNVDLLLACQDAKNGWVDKDRSSALFVNAVRCAADAGNETGKPVVVLSPTTGAVDARARALFHKHGIPCLMGQGSGMRALGKFLGCVPRDDAAPPASSTLDAAGTQGVRLETREVIRRLAARGVSHWPTFFARSVDDATNAAEEAGYPVVLKLEGRLAHRKVAGAVRLGMRDAGEVVRAWGELASLAEGIGFTEIEMSLQRLAFAQAELFVGAVDDDQFGPIVLFGLGGTDVERKQSCSVGLAPMERRGAGAVVDRLLRRTSILGQGEGTDHSVRRAIEGVISAVSEIICEPDVQAIDINPLLVLRDGVAIIDAKMVVAG